MGLSLLRRFRVRNEVEARPFSDGVGLRSKCLISRQWPRIQEWIGCFLISRQQPKLNFTRLFPHFPAKTDFLSQLGIWISLSPHFPAHSDSTDTSDVSYT